MEPPPADRWLALQTVMLPRDANPQASVLPGSPSPAYNTVFGGVILSLIDMAGHTGATHLVTKAGGSPPTLVTVALHDVEFHQPVLVGDVVRLLVSLVKMGRTSITVKVFVEVDRRGTTLAVTDAEVVFVGIDPASPDRRPKPLLPA